MSCGGQPTLVIDPSLYGFLIWSDGVMVCAKLRVFATMVKVCVCGGGGGAKQAK